MNICFLLNGFTVNGGIGRVVSVLANQLCQDEKYSVFALSFYDTLKPDFFSIQAIIKRENLFYESTSMKNAILKGGIKRLKQYLVNNDMDIIVACGALYYPIAVLACRMIKTKCICWEHGNTLTTDEYSFQTTCRRFGAKYGDYTVVLTVGDQQNYIRKYGAINIKQIYNPVDDQLFASAGIYDSKSKKIISVGRLAPPKNYSTLIDIARVLLPRHNEWSWDIYGDGELKEELNHKISALGLEKQLFLRGQADNMYQLYNQYAFLIMTSIREGFPMVLLEAAANSLPLISFDIETGPNEIIESGENGFLIKAFDAEEMIGCIEQLIVSDELRIEMSGKSKTICTKFSQKSILSKWKDIFERVAR